MRERPGGWLRQRSRRIERSDVVVPALAASADGSSADARGWRQPARSVSALRVQLVLLPPWQRCSGPAVSHTRSRDVFSQSHLAWRPWLGWASWAAGSHCRRRDVLLTGALARRQPRLRVVRARPPDRARRLWIDDQHRRRGRFTSVAASAMALRMTTGSSSDILLPREVEGSGGAQRAESPGPACLVTDSGCFSSFATPVPLT